MINTTLIYVEKDGQYLMLHRIKKQNDLNEGKWVGVGGKFEDGESPEECARREALEETGLTLTRMRYRGLVTFVSDKWPTEYMHLFTADRFEGALRACDEGELKWVDKGAVSGLNLWPGDRIFFELLEKDMPFFSLKLRYEGDRLAEAALNGDPLKY